MTKRVAILLTTAALVLGASLSFGQVLDCFECKTWNGSDRIYLGECGEGQATNTVTAFDYEAGLGYCTGSCPHDASDNRPEGLVLELCNCPDTLDQVTFFVSGNEGDPAVDAMAEYRFAATILTDGVYWANANFSEEDFCDEPGYFSVMSFNTTDDLCDPNRCEPLVAGDDADFPICADQGCDVTVPIEEATWSVDHPCYENFSFTPNYATYDCDDCSTLNENLEKKILSDSATLLEILHYYDDRNTPYEVGDPIDNPCDLVLVNGQPFEWGTNQSGLFTTEATVFVVDIPTMVYDPTVVTPGTEVQVLVEFLKLGEQGGVICAECPEEFICSCTKTVGVLGCQGGCTYCFPFLTAVEAGDFWDGIAISNYSGIAGTATLNWMGGGNMATTTLEVPAGSIATTTLTEQASALAAQGMAMDVGLILEVELGFTGDAFVFIASQGEGGSFAQGYLPRPGGCDDCAYESVIPIVAKPL